MGKSVGRFVLPLVAIGLTAAATGPWGLGLWGASSAGAAGAAGTGAALAPAAAATETMTAGAVSTLSSAGLPMSVPAAVGAGQSAGELALVSQAAAASGASAAANTGLWASLKANADLIGLGMSGAKTLMGMGQAQDQSQLEAALLQHQQLQDDLANEQRGLDNEIALNKTLAQQNNIYAAHGVDAGSGSALHMANAAEAAAEKRMLVGEASANNAASVYAIRRAAAKRNASGLMWGSLGDFGSDAFSVWSGRNKIGRA